MPTPLFVFKFMLSGLGLAWESPLRFTFWAESIANWSFGVAWLVKGEALRNSPTRFLYGN